MNYAIYLIAAVIALGMAAVAGHESEAATEPTDVQEAAHSRDFAARAVCQGQAFEWADDKTLVCFKERQ